MSFLDRLLKASASHHSRYGYAPDVALLTRDQWDDITTECVEYMRYPDRLGGTRRLAGMEVEIVPDAGGVVATRVTEGGCTLYYETPIEPDYAARC